MRLRGLLHTGSGRWTHLHPRRLICPPALRRREVRKPAVYDHAMGLFRSAVGLFRGRTRKDREEEAAGLPKEQAGTVKAPAEVARGEVKFEARPNPDNPGWGQIVGQDVGKAGEDRPSQE